MIRPVPHGMFGEMGSRCNHNLRLMAPGKSNICLICECNKIDDLLKMECSGNRKLSSGSIAEIIHRVRIINSVLDVEIGENLVEILLSPVLRTSIGLLEIHQDEVGTVVAQALLKICPKVPKNKLESFLQNLSAQILERTSAGNLECLSVLLQWKECLNCFLKNYGADVLPKLFEELEIHVSNMIKSTILGRSSAVLSVPSTSKSFLEINRAINESQYSSCSSIGTRSTIPATSTVGSAKESLRIVEKLFDVLQASCPTDVFVIVTDNEAGESQSSSMPHSEQAFSIFRPFLKGIMTSCMRLLRSNEIVKMTLFSEKILSFLDKLFHQAETLRSLFSKPIVTSASSVCSTIKKLFFSQSTELKIAALRLVNRMIVTYKQAMEDSFVDKGNVAHFPDVISQVDLIHFIADTMNTSCENLFRAAVEVLDLINQIPQFRNGRMIPVLESTLRISKMHIPDSFSSMSTYTSLNKLILNVLTSIEDGSVPPGIQQQLMYLFESLPNEWTPQQFLPWIKLLVFCREPELLDKLWSVFLQHFQRSRNLGKDYNVISLKCVLLIAYALMKCEFPLAQSMYLPVASSQNVQFKSMSELKEEYEKGREESAKKLMHYLMEPNFLPLVLAMVHHGTSNDNVYVTTLLELLKNYPEECLSARLANSIEAPVLETVQVFYDSENEDGQMTESRENPKYIVQFEKDSIAKHNGEWCWSPKTYMEILGKARLNTEFITSQQFFHLWNENVARILSICYPLYLSQLGVSLKYKTRFCPSSSDQENGLIESSNDQSIIKRILDSVDIEAANWAKNIGQGIFSANGMDFVEKQKQDVVLAYYFCHAHFAGKSLMDFVDVDFVERYCSFLYECLKQYDLTQGYEEEIPELDWVSLSFYFRTALMISTAFPSEQSTFADVFEKLLTDDPEACSSFKDDVMVYHCDVFVALFQWKFFVDFVSLIETWLKHDKNGCVTFFTNESSEEINNSLIRLASKGNQDASTLAVEVARKRLKKLCVSFDFKLVKYHFHELMGECSDDVDVLRRDKILLLRISNVIQLVIEDDYLFTSEQKFPLDFLHEVVRLMLKFPDTNSLIGKRSMKLLVKILRNETTFKNANTYLVHHREFVKFLGIRLNISDKNDVEESIYAHKLFALLITHNLDTFSAMSSTEPSQITWKLSSVFSYIQDIPKVEILEFLVAVFKANLKCPLIEVEEVTEPAKTLVKVLLNLLFHLQGMTQKITVRESKDAVWEILCEYLRLATTDLVKYSSFCADVLFQPWMKVSIGFLLAQTNHIPSQAPVMALEFLQRWTRMMLHNKLENPSKRSSMQELFVFQPYVGLFKEIKDCMKTDPTQHSSSNAANATAGNSEKEAKTLTSTEDWLAQAPDGSLQFYAIQKKAELISQIAKNCDIFLSCF